MKNQKESIRKMVGWLNNEEKDGGFWLPNIQRPFVWGEQQIERLFDSIMREYPISTLLVWKTKSTIRRRKFIDNYHHGLKLTDFFVPEDGDLKQLVLDGQQRLQSLFIGLKGSFDKRELHLNVLSGERVAPEDIRYQFRFLASSCAQFPWVRFKDLVFSNEKPRELKERVWALSPEPLETEQKERVEDNLHQLRQVFVNEEVLTYQELDQVDNPDSYDENDVVEIFIRANSGGTRLGKSDLLFSLLTASWELADEQMEELLEQLNQNSYRFTRDFILKVCLCLLKKGARYDVEKFRDEGTRESIIENWTKISAAIRDVRDFIADKTFIRSDRALPSYLGLIPLIYLRYHNPSAFKLAKGMDAYLLRTLLTGAFSGTPDNLIDRCIKRIEADGGFELDQIFGLIRADGRSLEIAPETLWNVRYGSKEIHLLFNLWYRDFNYQPAYQNNLPQVDHIFPQSALRKIKRENPSTGRMDLLRYYAEERDQLANCMLLTAEENGFSGKCDQPPNKWFAGKSDKYLEMHLIPNDPDLWGIEQYEQFVEARKALIEKKFSFLLQSSPV